MIPSTGGELAIADVGTRTGIWLFELDRRLPSPSTRLCGLDISSDQFPRPEWLPLNAQLRECNALDPAGPPADLKAAFDVVHVRLFIAIIKNNDPTVLLDFCYNLLKPGGYLQWDEHEPSINQVRSYRGSPTAGMEMISHMTRTQQPTAWIARLPRIFAERGFEVVDVDSKVVLPWQRGMYCDNWCMLADEFVERAERGGEGIDPVTDFYKQLSAKVSSEKQLGSYMEQTLQIVVGRKI